MEGFLCMDKYYKAKISQRNRKNKEFIVQNIDKSEKITYNKAAEVRIC